MSRTRLLNLTVACMLIGSSAAIAQFGAGDWTTAGFDAQRSFWVRSDPKISVENMRLGGFELVWKTNVNEGPRRNSFVTTPVLLDFYIGYRGFRSLAFIGSGADSVVAVDSDLGRLEWEKDFPAQRTSGSGQCPGGMTSSLARPTSIAYPAVTAARGFGRSSPAKSGVGEPFEGAVTLKEVANRRPMRPPVPAPSSAAAGRRTAAPANPFAPHVQWLYALTSDGKLHSVYVSNGDEPKDAVSFLPAGARAEGLIVADDVAYAATTNGCGGIDNGIWALDLPSKKVSEWKSAHNVAGTMGPAVGPDGTVYAAAGNQLVALEERTLKPKSSYTIGKQTFTSSPVIFEFRGKDLIAATSDDGRLHLIDTAAMDRPLAVSPPFSTPGFAAGALASWEDAVGTRWLVVPAGGRVAVSAGFQAAADVKNGAVVAWKVVDKGGRPALEPGWISTDMISPLTPIIVNNVVFAVSSGEYRAAGDKLGAAEIAKRSGLAVVHAFDGTTGKQLWNSGKTLTSYVTTGGLAAGGSRVYVATQDGTQYVFGFPIEH